MLAGIYNWFSEGLDTADPKEATGAARRIELPDVLAAYRQPEESHLI
jgi:hypothetical protein